MAWNSYPSATLVIDGHFGKYTIYALQYKLKYDWDGGLYRRSCDGAWGYYTALALQYYLSNRGFYKGKKDGDAKSMTWSALQDYLNSGPVDDKPGWNQPDHWNWPDEQCLGKKIQLWLNRYRYVG